MTQPNATSLTQQQGRAAGMLAAGNTVGDVANALGVDRATVWRWRQVPEFQEHANELRRLTWRAAADRMRQNAALAAEVLASILADPLAAPRYRVAAARVVLGAAGPLFPPVVETTSDSVESRGIPAVVVNDWRDILLDTARRASEMSGHLYLNVRTPGSAWAGSGLEEAFPGSYSRLRTFPTSPDELRAECARGLASFEDVLGRGSRRRGRRGFGGAMTIMGLL